jgi:hypothetical protein
LTITPTTIRDKTECPGVFCIYTGSDLYIDATHLCQQRTSGAMNWEAYIKDSRDNQIYRITQFSDNSWWFANELNTSDKRVKIYDGKSYYAGNNKPDCPQGWSYPSYAQLQTRAYRTNDNWGAQIICSKRFCCGAEYPHVGYDLLASDAINSLCIYNTACVLFNKWNMCDGDANRQDPNQLGWGAAMCRRN